MSFAPGERNFTISADSGNLTMQADGSYLAVWISGATIRGQRFNADGSHEDGQFQIASGGMAPQDVSATLLSNGQTILAWVENGSTYALRLGANGAVIGTLQNLGSTMVLNQHAPQVYDIGNGDYSVLYKGQRQGDHVDILAQTTVAGATVTKVPVASANNSHHAFVVLGNETFIILYHNPNAIQLEDVTHLGETKYITRTDASAPHNHSATALADSKFVVAWQDSATVGGTSVIKVQVFDADRDPIGAAVSFATPAGDVGDLAVTQLSDGGFALLLTINNGTDDDVYVASCSADGTILIEPSLVGTSAAGDQTAPDVVALANGEFVVSWLDSTHSLLMTEFFNGEEPTPNLAPTDIQLAIGGTTALVQENKAGGTVVATVTADDDGGTAGLRYFMTDGTFEIDAVTGEIKVRNGAVLDYESKSSHSVIVTVKDQDGTGLSSTQIITINVSDVPEPTNIRLVGGGTTALVDENKAGGVVVATVTADYDSGASGLRYFMTDSTFEIDAVTGQVKVRSGAVLDYESKSSHSVTVTVTAKDQNGADLSSTQVLTIKVSDVLEAVKGTNGKNVLTGGIGADKINGGAGNDVLTGGGGKDIFVFDTALGKGTTSKNQNKKVNFDTITDFNTADDSIWLDNQIFKKLGKSGSEASPSALNKSFFRVGNAKDKNDYITYKKGVVYYDADGSGARYKPVEIIKIGNKAQLTSEDFLIV